VGSRSAIPLLDVLGVNPSIVADTAPYIRALSWSTPSLLVFTAVRRYLISTHRPAPVMLALISANLVNAGGNWAFIYGKFGLPAMGTEGSGASRSKISNTVHPAPAVNLSRIRQHHTRRALCIRATICSEVKLTGG
jgi:MATE family multidrug resistance protein